MAELQRLPDGYTQQGTFNTFAGTDMTVYFGPREVGVLMSLTVSVVREVVPIYTTASANPRAFAKGKRAISGSLVFGQFDRHALLEDVFEDKNHADVIRSEMNEAAVNTGAEALRGVGTEILFGNGNLIQERNYSDQLPPFDVVVAMVNENGAASSFAVRDVVIVNEGFGFTVDDITQEMACSYVARTLVRLTPVNRAGERDSDFMTPGLSGTEGRWG
jgi:hypothetical protein